MRRSPGRYGASRGARFAHAFVPLVVAAALSGCGSTGTTAAHPLADDRASPGSSRVYFLRPDPGFIASGGLAGSRPVTVEIGGEKLLSLARGEYTMVHLKPGSVAVTVKAWANELSVSGGSSLGRPAETQPFAFWAGQTYFIAVRPRSRGSLLGPAYAPEAVDLATAQEMGQALTPVGAAVERPVSAVRLGRLDRIQAVVEGLEAAEARAGPGAGARAPEGLGGAAREIGAYLGSNPDDVRALILAARVGRMENMAVPMVIRGGPDWKEQMARAEAEGRQRGARLQGLLDRALAVEPGNAEAHYWKARLHGISRPGIRGDRAATVIDDLDQAVASATRAVKLAPDNVTYREALAQYLVGGQRWAEAKAALEPVMGGRHPISLLLGDLEALPLPPAAAFSPEDSEGFAEVQRTSGVFRTYAYVRTRVYIFPGPASEVEAFYRRHWPGFRLFAKGKDEERMYHQHFHPRAGRMEPATRPGQAKGSPDEGVALMVAEERKSTGGERRDLSRAVGEVSCRIFVLAVRGVASW